MAALLEAVLESTTSPPPVKYPAATRNFNFRDEGFDLKGGGGDG